MIKSRSKKNFYQTSIFIVLIYSFVFQEPLTKIIPTLQYLDELYAFLLIPLLIIKLYKKDTKNVFTKKMCCLFLPLILLIIIGTISSIIYKYQPSTACVSDLIAILKFPLALLVTKLLFDQFDIKAQATHIKKHIDGITLFLAIMSILNYLLKIFPYTVRYGIMSNQLFYSHPGKLVLIGVFLIAVNYLVSLQPFNLTHFVLSAIVFSTLRAKGIGFVIAASILVFYIKRANKHISTKWLIVTGIITVTTVIGQIQIYFNNPNSARYILLDTSIKIANDHIPFGAGFGTFGSHSSITNYSTLYTKYRIDNIYGFTKTNYSYVMDSFWPMILAEFGYIGVILYVWFILNLFLSIQNIPFRNNKRLYIAQLVCFIYLIISSTSETAFVNPMAVTLALILGLPHKTKRIIHKKQPTAKRKISVIIPISPVEEPEKVTKCLESILSQTYTNLEVVLATPKLTSDSYDSLYEKIIERDDRVKILYADNIYNLAQKSANGHYILFIDSNSYITNPGFLLEAKETIEAEKSDLVVFDHIENSTPTSRWNHFMEPDTLPKTKIVEMALYKQFDDSLYNKLFKRSLFGSSKHQEKQEFQSANILYEILAKANTIHITDKICCRYISRKHSSITISEYIKKIRQRYNYIKQSQNINQKVLNAELYYSIYRIIRLMHKSKSQEDKKTINTQKLHHEYIKYHTEFKARENNFVLTARDQIYMNILYYILLIRYVVIQDKSKTTEDKNSGNA